MDALPKMSRGAGSSIATMQIEKGTSVERVGCTETGTDTVRLSQSNAATSIDSVVDGLVDELQARIESQNDEITALKRQLVLKDAEIERLSVVQNL